MSEVKVFFRVGILPGIADLYNRLWPETRRMLNEFISQVAGDMQIENVEIITVPAVSTVEETMVACEELRSKDVDLIIVALAPYCPSGVLVPSLAKLDTALLLWPVQSMFELEPEKYDINTIRLNHGVHAVQDMANVLGKTKKKFGIVHGHLKQDDFKAELQSWARAGRIISAIKRCNPVQIGGHFENMLDLQTAGDDFIKKFGLRPKTVSLKKFSKLLNNVDDYSISQYVQRYRDIFEISENVSEPLLLKTAAGEVALRLLMKDAESSACGLNFVEFCNDESIADPLHVASSVLMQEGYGYAGEGDWLGATMVYGMQQGFGIASFSEMFSVGYADNRLVLRHWGEGNFAMGREKPQLCFSSMNDRYLAEFAIVSFEFQPRQTTLINLSSTSDSNGQIISVGGTIMPDKLPNADGPRAVFKPECKDVRRLLNNYAYNGGSHHLAIVNGDCAGVLEKLSVLTGWKYINL